MESPEQEHLQSLNGLIACRQFLSDPVLSALEEFRTAAPEKRTSARAAVCSLLLEKAETLPLTGSALRSYLIYLLAEGDFPAARAIERTGCAGANLRKALIADFRLLRPYLTEKPAAFLDTDLFDDYSPGTPAGPCRRTGTDWIRHSALPRMPKPAPKP